MLNACAPHDASPELANQRQLSDLPPPPYAQVVQSQEYSNQQLLVGSATTGIQLQELTGVVYGIPVEHSHNCEVGEPVK